jgi:uncharacterized protein YraI
MADKGKSRSNLQVLGGRYCIGNGIELGIYKPLIFVRPTILFTANATQFVTIKIVTSLLITTLHLTPLTLMSTRTSPPTIRGCVVNATALFIRSGPGKSFSSVGHYNGGDCATIKGRNSDDTWVMTDKGWVSAYYMDIEGELTELLITSSSTPASSISTAVKTKAPTPRPTSTKMPKPSPTKVHEKPDCDPSYPDPGVCIPSPPPDLDCGDISYRRFRVLSPDPHRFDGDDDGIGCER